MVIFAVLTVFWLFLTIGVPVVTGLPRLYQSVPIVYQWSKQSKTVKRQSKQQKWPLVYQSSHVYTESAEYTKPNFSYLEVCGNSRCSNDWLNIAVRGEKSSVAHFFFNHNCDNLIRDLYYRIFREQITWWISLASLGLRKIVFRLLGGKKSLKLLVTGSIFFAKLGPIFMKKMIKFISYISSVSNWSIITYKFRN